MSLPRGSQSVNPAVLRIQDRDLEGPVAFLGGPYSNHLALRAASEDARRRGARRRFFWCYGSPRRPNGFLWESACSDPFLMGFPREAEADTVLCAPTGPHGRRSLPDGGLLVTAGPGGGPANDGRPEVWYALLDAG